MQHCLSRYCISFIHTILHLLRHHLTQCLHFVTPPSVSMYYFLEHTRTHTHTNTHTQTHAHTYIDFICKRTILGSRLPHIQSQTFGRSNYRYINLPIMYTIKVNINLITSKHSYFLHSDSIHL